MHDTISGIFLDARQRLPHNKLEGIFSLITKHEADIRYFIVSMDYAYLILFVLDGDHACEYDHSKLS